MAHLKACCPELGAFIAQHGAFRLRVDPENDIFKALARAIVYQQLSGKAAGTIHGRFMNLFDNDQPEPTQALDLGMAPMREAGLSNNKALAILDLAERSAAGTLANYRKLARMSDEEVIGNLSQVRGIGPWTAQMYLMFNLGRPDVMPATDLGVQKGVQAVYRLRSLPAPADLLQRTEHLAPFRSAASWYFWRAADTVLMT